MRWRNISDDRRCGHERSTWVGAAACIVLVSVPDIAQRHQPGTQPGELIGSDSSGERVVDLAHSRGAGGGRLSASLGRPQSLAPPVIRDVLAE